jgi:hypothetical protein
MLITVVTRLLARRSWVMFQGEVRDLSSFHTVQASLWPSLCPIEGIQGAFLSLVKQPGSEDDLHLVLRL